VLRRRRQVADVIVHDDVIAVVTLSGGGDEWELQALLVLEGQGGGGGGGRVQLLRARVAGCGALLHPPGAEVPQRPRQSQDDGGQPRRGRRYRHRHATFDAPAATAGDVTVTSRPRARNVLTGNGPSRHLPRAQRAAAPAPPWERRAVNHAATATPTRAAGTDCRVPASANHVSSAGLMSIIARRSPRLIIT